MAVAYTAKERAGLDAKALALLEACPDVGSFIRRGLGRDPEPRPSSTPAHGAGPQRPSS